jgi:hypothetical protein
MSAGEKQNRATKKYQDSCDLWDYQDCMGLKTKNR